jgi:thioesterase domain-containing protein
MIHPPGGIVVCYRDLARLAPQTQPFFAVRSRGLHGDESLPKTVAAMAADYVEAIAATVPNGPYQLGGWSLGGMVAWEVARQLIDVGQVVERMILLDTAIPETAAAKSNLPAQPSPGLEYGLDYTLEQLGELRPEEQLPLLWDHARALGVLNDDTPQAVVDQTLSELKHLFHHHLSVIGKQRLEPLNIPVLLIRPRDVPVAVGSTRDRGWSALAPDVTVEFVSGHHHNMVKPPGVNEIAKLIFDRPHGGS